MFRVCGDGEIQTELQKQITLVLLIQSLKFFSQMKDNGKNQMTILMNIVKKRLKISVCSTVLVVKVGNATVA